MDKVVVITGASGGIGAALARRLGEAGARLVLAARREAELQAVAAPYEANALTVVTDVWRRADVERLRDAALARFGQVDVWVNNAGRGILRPTLDLTDEDVDEMMAVNVKSALYGMQAIIPHFKEGGQGHLINVSSFLGRVPMASVRSVYSAAKAALNSLTANARMDLARDYPGIHISLVMPGPVSTDFIDNLLGATPGMRSAVSGVLQFQTADEVAAVMVDLIDHPQPEIYTAPGLQEMARQYYQDITAFEAGMRRPR